MSLNKKCAQYTDGHVGRPCIATLDRDRFVVADWTGHLTFVDLAAHQVSGRVYVGIKEIYACETLRSLSIEPTGSGLAAVATRGGYAAVVDLESMETRRIIPAKGGTVNAVAFSPSLCLLAIGTGFYPLGDDRQPAHVELWALDDDEPALLSHVALPGVCVDALAWDEYGDEIAVATGSIGQDRGSLARLDTSTLRPVAFFDTPRAHSVRLAYLDLNDRSSHLAIVSPGLLHVLNAHDGREAWRIELEKDVSSRLTDFAIDSEGEGLALTTGEIVAVNDGSVIDRIMPMKDCTSLSARDRGGYLGVSSRGRFCVWE